jgi:hypothetical protein
MNSMGQSGVTFTWTPCSHPPQEAEEGDGLDAPPPGAAPPCTWLPAPAQQGRPAAAAARLLLCGAASGIEAVAVAAPPAGGAGADAAAPLAGGAAESVHRCRAALAALAALPGGWLLAVEAGGDALVLAAPEAGASGGAPTPVPGAPRRAAAHRAAAGGAGGADAMEEGTPPPEPGAATRGGDAGGWDYAPAGAARSGGGGEPGRGHSVTPASPMHVDGPGAASPRASGGGGPAAAPPRLSRLSQPGLASRGGDDADAGAPREAPQPPRRRGAPRRQRLPLLQRLHQPGPLAAMAVADLLSDGCPQVYGALSRPEGGLQLLRGALAAPLLAAGPPGMLCGVGGLWPVPGACAPLVVLSSAGGSRAMAVLDSSGGSCSGSGGGKDKAPVSARPEARLPRAPGGGDDAGAAAAGLALVDVSDVLGLCSAEPTLAAGAFSEGALVQVAPSGAYLCSTEGLALRSEQPPGAPWRCSPKSSRGSGGGGGGREGSPARLARGSGGGAPHAQPRARPLMPALAAAAAAAAVGAAAPSSEGEGAAAAAGPSVSMAAADSACDMALDDDASSGARPRSAAPQPAAAAAPGAAPAPRCWAGSHWAPPDGDSVSLAAVAPGLVAAHLTPSRRLALVCAAGAGEGGGSGGGSGGGGGGPGWASPGRKRGRGAAAGAGCRLAEADPSAAAALSGEQLSCLHAAPAPPGRGGGPRWWLAAGRYDGAVEVAVVSRGGARVSRAALLQPEDLSGAAEPAAAPGAHTDSPLLLRPAAVPHSVVALPLGGAAPPPHARARARGASGGGGSQGGGGRGSPGGDGDRAGAALGGLLLLVSFRDGRIGLYEVAGDAGAPPAAGAATSSADELDAAAVPAPPLRRARLLWRARAGGAPVTLSPAPLAPGAPHEAAVPAADAPLRLLAIGERTWVLTVDRRARALRLQPLALPGALLAAPVALPPVCAPGGGGSGGAAAAGPLPAPLAAVLFVQPDGALCLAAPELCAPPRVHRSLAGLGLRQLCAMEAAGKLVALGGPALAGGGGGEAGGGGGGGAPPEGVHVIDPASGAVVCSWPLKPGERGMALCLWPSPAADAPPPPPPHGGSRRRSRGSSGSAGSPRGAARGGGRSGGGGGGDGAGPSSAPAHGGTGLRGDPGSHGLFHFPDLLRRFREGLSSPRHAGGRAGGGAGGSGSGPAARHGGHWGSASPPARRSARGAGSSGGAGGGRSAGGAGPSASWDGAGAGAAALRSHQLAPTQAPAGGAFVLVGTHSGARGRRRGGDSDDSTASSPDDDEPEGGRVCVLQLLRCRGGGGHHAAGRHHGGGAADRGGAWALRLVASLRMPFAVSALAPLDGSRFVVSIGGFLAAYGLADGGPPRRLRQLGAVAARAPAAALAAARQPGALRPAGGRAGGGGGDGRGGAAWLVAAADRAQGLVVYQAQLARKAKDADGGSGEGARPAEGGEEGEDEEEVVLLPLWAHDEVRPIVSVAALPAAGEGGVGGAAAAPRGGRWLCLDAGGSLLEVAGLLPGAAPTAGPPGGAASGSGTAAAPPPPGGPAPPPLPPPPPRLPLAGRVLKTLAEMRLDAGPAVALAALPAPCFWEDGLGHPLAAPAHGGAGGGAKAARGAAGAGAWHAVVCGRDGGITRAAPLPPGAAAAARGSAGAGGARAARRAKAGAAEAVIDAHVLEASLAPLGGAAGSAPSGAGAGSHSSSRCSSRGSLAGADAAEDEAGGGGGGGGGSGGGGGGGSGGGGGGGGGGEAVAAGARALLMAASDLGLR